MKSIIVLLTTGAFALTGSDLANCNLGGLSLATEKEYLDVTTIPLTTDDCTQGKCQLSLGASDDCQGVSVLPSFKVDNKDEDRTKLIELIHHNKGKEAYTGINFDFSSFKESAEKYWDPFNQYLVKPSTLTLDFKNLNKIEDFSKVFPDFKAVFIKNPDLTYDYFDKNAFDKEYFISYIREVDDFIRTPNVYTIMTSAQYTNVSSKLPNINVVIEEEKYIFSIGRDPFPTTEPEKAVWYRIVRSQA
ncbi:hypothetical protein DSO57_1003714 [Entomophthora muscae]|uniref:Uncharacterized protein n=1 Tax=Entomophthora muscae TaxID=34485 RepID=A0ACC2SXD1_9FUNG|nr:hypothetical protein DSO57_1003714 [Entomophthora muscae]